GSEADSRSSGIPRYCGVTPIEASASPNLLVSLRMTSASSAGLLPTGVVPSSLRRAVTSGDLRILLIAPLSLSMIGCGVPAGASIAFQATISNSGTNSEIAGMSGAGGAPAQVEQARR